MSDDRTRVRWVLLLVFAMLVVACGDGAEPGGDVADQGSGGTDTAGDPSAEQPTGEGGGTLIFDGEEIQITRARCSIFGDMIEVATETAAGHQAFVGRQSSDIYVSILDAEGTHWLPQNPSGGDEAVHDGDTFTSGEYSYFNNSDDRIIEASFTVECP